MGGAHGVESAIVGTCEDLVQQQVAGGEIGKIVGARVSLVRHITIAFLF